jgi:menaquinone-specific isochorismate synthase
MPQPTPDPVFSPCNPAATAWLNGGGFDFCARGFRERTALPPATGTAFYVNDFALSDPRPWRVPVEIGPVEAAPPVQPPALVWEEPPASAFSEVFSELMDSVRRRDILKAVPVASAAGRVLHGELRAWLRHSLTKPADDPGSFGFAWLDGDSGFGGFTPEILFQIDGRRLITMALAGTTDAAHAEELTQRPKLSREHAVVVDELQRRLARLGEVRTGRREVVRHGNIRHLRTPLEVTLTSEPTGEALNDIIRLLHPTPALGIMPRTEQTMQMLTRCRERTGTPAAFGAPFGVAWPGGAIFVVAIRAVFWQGNQLLLPAGGGLVAGSEFEAEWAELELKRAWVRRALGLSGDA